MMRNYWVEQARIRELYRFADAICLAFGVTLGELLAMDTKGQNFYIAEIKKHLKHCGEDEEA